MSARIPATAAQALALATAALALAIRGICLRRCRSLDSGWSHGSDSEMQRGLRRLSARIPATAAQALALATAALALAVRGIFLTRCRSFDSGWSHGSDSESPRGLQRLSARIPATVAQALALATAASALAVRGICLRRSRSALPATATLAFALAATPLALASGGMPAQAGARGVGGRPLARLLRPSPGPWSERQPSRQMLSWPLP